MHDLQRLETRHWLERLEIRKLAIESALVEPEGGEGRVLEDIGEDVIGHEGEEVAGVEEQDSHLGQQSNEVRYRS